MLETSHATLLAIYIAHSFWAYSRVSPTRRTTRLVTRAPHEASLGLDQPCRLWAFTSWDTSSTLARILSRSAAMSRPPYLARNLSLCQRKDRTL